MDLAAYLADYGADASLSLLDGDGQSYATPTAADLAEFVRSGTVRGRDDHGVGVVWTDENENLVSVHLSPDEVRALESL